MSFKFRDFIALINGFRKFTTMFALIILGAVFRVTGHLSGEEMVDLLRYTAVAYMTANSVEHITNSVKDWIKNKVNKEIKGLKE